MIGLGSDKNAEHITYSGRWIMGGLTKCTRQLGNRCQKKRFNRANFDQVLANIQKQFALFSVPTPQGERSFDHLWPSWLWIGQTGQYIKFSHSQSVRSLPSLETSSHRFVCSRIAQSNTLFEQLCSTFICAYWINHMSYTNSTCIQMTILFI